MARRALHPMRIRAAQPIGNGMNKGKIMISERSQNVPWPKHELASQLRGIAAPLPHGHPDAQSVRDDHREPAHGAMTHVRARRAALGRGGARLVCARRGMAHAERAVQRLAWRCVYVELVGKAEDLCRCLKRVVRRRVSWWLGRTRTTIGADEPIRPTSDHDEAHAGARERCVVSVAHERGEVVLTQGAPA